MHVYVQTSPGVWEDAEELPENFATGYGYAIATGSSTVLAFYQSRCLADVRMERLPKTFDCTYKVDYTAPA